MKKFILTLLFAPLFSFAQDTTLPPLRDYNGDGLVNVVAFGDSITRGVGDFIESGDNEAPITFPTGEAGYPLRVEKNLGVSVMNFGDPGEELSNTGVARFSQIVAKTKSDVIVFSEGANDTRSGVSQARYERLVQTVINLANANGTQIMLMTIPPPPTCCAHRDFAYPIFLYNETLAYLGLLNNVPVARVSQAVLNGCPGASCKYFNLPEGLHPNKLGYDVFGEIVTAALLGLDLIDPAQRELFSQATSIPLANIKTVSNQPTAPAN